MSMTFEITDPVAFFRGQSEYWRRVDESEGFDLEGIIAPEGTTGLRPFNCENNNFGFGYPGKVDLYAKVGLHRYNMLEGTNLQLARVIKFNKLRNCLASYYITLVASDPVSGSQLPFQVRVDEHRLNRLGLTVSVARPKGDSARSTREPFSTMEPPFMEPSFLSPMELAFLERPFSTIEPPFSSLEPPFSTIMPPFTLPDELPEDELPEWPSGDAFTDSKRFYLVEESELRDTDWIGLYLQLQVCLCDCVDKANLSKLKILKVAIEDVEASNERLNAKSAIVYITFKGLATRRISADYERKAIIRRVIDERGCLSLLGGFSGEEDTNFTTMTTLECFEYAQRFFNGTISI